MLFTCNAASHEQCDHPARDADAVDTAPGGRSMQSSLRAPRGLRVDFHCHYFDADAAAKAAVLKPFENDPSIVYATPMTRDVNVAQMRERASKFADAATRLRDMDRMGIDVQVVSPAPSQYYYYADPGFGLSLAKDVNNAIAEFVAAQPERFTGLGTVPLQDAKLATKELERCVRKLGFRGLEIGTNVNGVDLADPRLGLDRFFAKAQELDAVLFMHPMGFTHAQRLTEHYFNNIIGNPLESTLAVSHLIFGGVLDRYPRLKICVAHGGGYLAHYHARMDHGWKARSDARTILKKKPSTYLKKFYYDTITFDPGLLENLIERVGAKHVMLGSDYPFDMGDEDPVGLVEGLTGVSEEDKASILGGTAARLLKIRRRRGAQAR